MTAVAELVLHEMKDLDLSEKIRFSLEELPLAWGDYAMIKQIFVNLISNAIKYSDKKDKPLVEINSFVRNNENVYQVKDNGAGFDMRYYSKLFGVFQRLHDASEFEGNGVGLALVKRIVSRHGGEVWAESKPGEGASFYFTLPGPGGPVIHLNTDHSKTQDHE